MTLRKWINTNINKFLGTSFTVRETEIMTLGATFTLIVVAYLLMYNVIFPNIQPPTKDQTNTNQHLKEQKKRLTVQSVSPQNN